MPDLEPDEAAALELAASMVRIDGPGFSGGLWKVGAVGDVTAGEGLAALPSHPQLGDLFTAVAERRTVRFAYRGVERTADPLRLDFARGRWYLLAHDHDRADDRWFRLDRMGGAVRSGPINAFDRDTDDADANVPDPWSIGTGEPVVATVAVDARHPRIVRALLGDDAVVAEAPDGGIVVELAVAPPPAAGW